MFPSHLIITGAFIEKNERVAPLKTFENFKMEKNSPPQTPAPCIIILRAIKLVKRSFSAGFFITLLFVAGSVERLSISLRFHYASQIHRLIDSAESGTK
jgi:hypothetical protein